MTDRSVPRAGLCVSCMKANRAPGYYHCPDCQVAWDNRHKKEQTHDDT